MNSVSFSWTWVVGMNACMTLRKFVKLVILEDYECAHYATGYQWLDLMLFYTLIILIMTFEQKINIIKMGLQVRVNWEREREREVY